MKEKAKYIHLFEELKRRILQGEYQNGQRLPGENEMAGEFAMSRQTVRQALSLLEQEGSGVTIQVREDFPGLLALLSGYPVAGMRMQTQTLEELFLHYYGGDQ